MSHPVSDRRMFLQHAGRLAVGAGAWASASVGAVGAPHPLAPVASPAVAEAQAPPLPGIGTPLPLPEVALFDGRVFRPVQAERQVLLVYWWASTCPFCALQSPEVQKLWLAHKDRGLRMVALSVDRTPEEAMAYLRKKGYDFPSGWVTSEIQRILPKPRGLPITVVRGRDGRVLQAERGQMFAEDVAQLARWL